VTYAVASRGLNIPHGVRSGELGGQRSSTRSSAVVRLTQPWDKCWGSRERVGDKVAEPNLADKWCHHCNLQTATTIPVS
jgi:hypothetical protein